MSEKPTDNPAGDRPQDQQPDAETRNEQASVAEAESTEPTAEDLASVEAILFTTDSPISPGRIAEIAQFDGGRKPVLAAIAALNERYERIGSAFRIESRASGYRMFTQPEHNEVLARLLKVRSESRLSQAAMETLAIIAYKQPVLRADIEAIRGVSSGEMVRSLMEKSLVKIVGRAEEIGRPMLYGTTSKFLEVFGLNTLKDLPEIDIMALGAGKAINAKSDLPAATDANDEPPVADQADASETDEKAVPSESISE